MNKKIILMFLLPGAFFLMNPTCYDETRQQFTFNGTINNISTGWTISCADNCSSCFGYPEGNNTNTDYLDKKLYPDVYRKCASLSGPLVNIDSLLNSGGTTNNGRCSFDYPFSPYYGFDDVLDNSIDDVHYLSFAAKCSSNVRIFLGPGAYSTYKKVIAVLPSSALNNISFDKSVNKDTIQLKHDGSNSLTVYSLKDFANGETYELYVYGIYDPANPDCLAGDCGGADQRLKIVVYPKRTIDSLYVYSLGNQSFNPANTDIKSNFNTVLKPAVVDLAGVKKDSVATIKGDLNGNGCLDIFNKLDSVPVEWTNEYYSIIDSIEKEYSGCVSCHGTSVQAPKIFLLPNKINMDWILMKDASAGSDIIVVQYDSFLVNNCLEKDLILSNWDGSDSETIQISNSINNEYFPDSAHNLMAFKLYNNGTLKYSHSRKSVLIRSNCIGGVTYTGLSCSIISSDTAMYHKMIHEFLHMAVVGPLSHTINDTTNIMYPTTPPTNNFLRYRKLNTDNKYGLGSPESQWNVLHTHNH
jgi:hypothetical protein